MRNPNSLLQASCTKAVSMLPAPIMECASPAGSNESTINSNFAIVPTDHRDPPPPLSRFSQQIMLGFALNIDQWDKKDQKWIQLDLHIPLWVQEVLT